jgi:hypothetical protein
MDEGMERIRRLSREARDHAGDAERDAEANRQAAATDQACLAELERTVPERLRQLAEAADGSLSFEDSAFRSRAATAMQIRWRPGAAGAHAVELWLQRDTGSVEWRWEMGYREAPIVHRVPASRFTLARLDDLVTALADPRAWRGGHPPEI